MDRSCSGSCTRNGFYSFAKAQWSLDDFTILNNNLGYVCDLQCTAIQVVVVDIRVILWRRCNCLGSSSVGKDPKTQEECWGHGVRIQYRTQYNADVSLSTRDGWSSWYQLSAYIHIRRQQSRTPLSVIGGLVKTKLIWLNFRNNEDIIRT